MARPKAFDQTRALEHAMHIFWSKGYEATSVQDLVEAMGINRGSLYATFGDKHQLFLRALQHYRQRTCPTMEQLFTAHASPKTAIHEMLLHIVAASLADPQQRGCFMNNTIVELGTHDPETAKIICANSAFMETVLHDVLQRAQQAGEIAADKDLRALTHFLISVIHGLRVVAKTAHDRAMLENIVNVTMSAL